MLNQATVEFLSTYNLYPVKLAVAAVVLAVVFQRKKNGRFSIRGLEISDFVDISRRAEDAVLAGVATLITVFSFDTLVKIPELFMENNVGDYLFFMHHSGNIAIWTVSVLVITTISLDFLKGSGDPFGRVLHVFNWMKEKF